MLPTSHYLCRSVCGTRLRISVAVLIMLWARRSRALPPRGKKVISLLQTRPGTHPTSHSMGSFARAKETVAWSWPIIFNCRSELYRVYIRALILLLFYHGATAPVGHDLHIIEYSWLHSDTPHSVGLLWTSDQPDAETSTWQHTTLTTDRQTCPRGDSNLQSQEVIGPYTARPLGPATNTIISNKNRKCTNILLGHNHINTTFHYSVF
jgi:hypothetical protein